MERGKQMNHTARHTELDIARGLGIFFMVLVHVSSTFSPNDNRVILFLGRFPAAPVFMLALGTGIVFSRHSSSRELACRGLKLFIFSYVYNFLAYVLPDLHLHYFDGTLHSLLVGLRESYSHMICVDILQFGGLALLYFALVKKLRLRDRHILLLSGCIAVLGTVLRFTTSIQGVTAQALIGLFWGTSPDMSYFPFASWIIYPTVGYLFARHVLQTTEDKRRLYLCIGPIGGILYIALSVITAVLHIEFANLGVIHETAYYHMHFVGNICVIAFLAAWISICYALRALPAPIIGTLVRWSRHITPIYVLHMIIIHYLAYFLPYGFSPFKLALLALSILLTVDLLISAYCSLIRKRR